MASRERPQIIYALVVRGPKVVLAEYTGLGGNFQQATIQILQKLEQTVEFKSYIYGEYAFHYIIDAATGLWFVCMAEKDMGRRIPFGFLGAVQDAFNQRYTLEQVQSAIAYAMNQDFRGDLQHLMEKYNSPNADRVTSMMEKVKHIDDTLRDSIDKILERQEKIELLVNRSQMLSQQSSSFRRDAERVRRAVWWRNTRTIIIFALVGVLAILLIIWLLFKK